MSWLGGTLSSLTNQISSLTNEVLLEGREESDDRVAQLQVSKGRLEQLEGCNATLRKEVERLRASNAELEDRCHATELQLCAERQAAAAAAAVAAASAAGGRARNRRPPDDVENESNHKLADLLEQQRQRIQELESALAEANYRQQVEVAELQSHHAKQLAQARLQQHSTVAGTETNGEVPCVEQTVHLQEPQVTEQARPRARRRTRDATSQTEDDPETSYVEELQQEKLQLEASLVELDQQNQEVLTQLLAVKAQLEAENREQAEALKVLHKRDQRVPVVSQASQTELQGPTSPELRDEGQQTENGGGGKEDESRQFMKVTASTCQASQTDTPSTSDSACSTDRRLDAKDEDQQTEEERASALQTVSLETTSQFCQTDPESIGEEVSEETAAEDKSSREEESLRADLEEAREKCSRLETMLERAVPGERQEADGQAAQEPNDALEERLRVLQADKDRILSVMNEKSRESSSLKAEVHRLLGVVAHERQALAQLRRENEEKMASAARADASGQDAELAREALRNLSRLVRDRELEVEAQKQKNGTLLQLLRQCSPVDGEQLKELLEEREALSRQLTAAEQERAALKSALELREREVADARAEADKLALELGALRLERDSQLQQLEEKRGALAAGREEALALKGRLSEAENQLRELREQRDRLAGELEACSDVAAAGGGDSKGRQLEHSNVGTSEESSETVDWKREAENMQAQVLDLRQKESKLQRELERLRTHLLQMEEGYTEEALQAEAREQSLRARLLKLEDWARVSESVAHNATEQASQQVGSLAQQLAEARSNHRALEEELHQTKASLGNLQQVLDHFQTEKDREIQLLRSSYESQLTMEREKSQQLVELVSQKQEQLESSRDALEAATRLSQQLDRKEETIVALKQQVGEREAELERVRQEVYVVRSTTEGKVDKQVMKSLVLGYFSSPQGQRPEVVRLLARVLDFSREEMDKAGISLGIQEGTLRVGWISGFFRRGGGTDSASEVSRPLHRQSFSALFVKFLEEESEPQQQVRLPVEAMAAGTVASAGRHQSSALVPRAQGSPLLLQPMAEALPTLAPVVAGAPLPEEPPAALQSAFLKEMLG
ncbi:thyroid receptor-interacting protein 11 isoform X2 [Ixodes scapularis]|uniref:thyroid receptor-interacting protein 11 isoform X2 n=1 Tax=Ixodes scapularis TaxID=6945 RepID=UPI001C38B56E|nr:thyroid receptor-interacting protein 11 isoform X2 [Ixodes scapularis]